MGRVGRGITSHVSVALDRETELRLNELSEYFHLGKSNMVRKCINSMFENTDKIYQEYLKREEKRRKYFQTL